MDIKALGPLFIFSLNWKSLESPLDSKENKLVNPKGNQPWLFAGRIDAEAEAPILWPPDAKSQLIGKDLDSGKDWRQEKGMTKVKMDGWMSGPEFEQTQGDSEGQGSMVCCIRSQSQTQLSDWAAKTLKHFWMYLTFLTGRNHIQER